MSDDDDQSMKSTAQNPAMVRCEACGGSGTRKVTAQGGRVVEEACSWCGRLGVMTPAALSGWHEYIRTGRRPKAP